MSLPRALWAQRILPPALAYLAWANAVDERSVKSELPHAQVKVIARRQRNRWSRGHQACSSRLRRLLQDSLRCDPRRNSVPGTFSLRIAAALIASAFGRIS